MTIKLLLSALLLASSFGQNVQTISEQPQVIKLVLPEPQNWPSYPDPRVLNQA